MLLLKEKQSLILKSKLWRFWGESEYMRTLPNVRKANCMESTGMSLFSSLSKADLQDPSWVPVGISTSLMTLGLKHRRCRTFLQDLKSSYIPFQTSPFSHRNLLQSLRIPWENTKGRKDMN